MMSRIPREMIEMLGKNRTRVYVCHFPIAKQTNVGTGLIDPEKPCLVEETWNKAEAGD